jgi:CheY-like chemotaxis protein
MRQGAGRAVGAVSADAPSGWWGGWAAAQPPSSDRPAAASRTTPPAPDQRPTSPATILIVEDHPEIQTTLAELLEDEGYGVVTAANGQDALTYLRQAATLPSLIVLDLMMPVMDGWTFRDIQARDPALQAIPVIVISAISNARQQRMPIAAAAYLPKPLNFQLVLQTVARLCVPASEDASR